MKPRNPKVAPQRPAPKRGWKQSRGDTPRPQPTLAGLRDASRGIRLQKAMADAGVASRRDCEAMIAEGRVRVNGEVVDTLPAWVDPKQDVIEVDGQRVTRGRQTKRGEARHVYIMVYKPRGVISTNEDPEGRKRVIDLVDAEINARLFPVGRLDADSTGLILLTDDGELANRLTHPRYEVTKEYEVSIKGRLTPEDVERLKKGLLLTNRRRRPAGTAAKAPVKRAAMEQVRILGHDVDRERGDRTRVAITLREGQNREIRRLLARLGFKVRRLKRISIGPLRLKGVEIGGWRMLTSPEVNALRKAAREAGSDA